MHQRMICIWIILLCLMLSACSGVPVSEVSAGTEMAFEPTVSSVMESTEEAVPQPEQTTDVHSEWKEPEDEDFVAVAEYVPNIVIELKYATEDNFTGQVIYDFKQAYLRYGTVKKLRSVQQELQTMGFGLKLWDGFRPVSAQFALWEVYPDPTYVADPTKGHSSHSRGNTVDLTLIDFAGNPVEMPTGFDDFTALADRDYSDCTSTAAENAMMLQSVMEKYGFSGYFGEWWHYSDADRYEVEHIFDPSVISTWYADCKEFISLRKEPDTNADVITRIPAKDTFWLLGYDNAFAMVEYMGQRGYVLAQYISPAG